MESRDPKELQAALEAFLFLYGEPVSFPEARKALKVADDAFHAALSSLKDALRDASRGLALIEEGERIQLVTKPAFGALRDAFMKEVLRAELTPAAVEALAVVAYAGPVARSGVDYLRGVNSSFIIRSLLLRGLIERSPDPERGNVYQYRVSMEFLKHLGLASRENLPDYAGVRRVIETFRTEPVSAGAPPAPRDAGQSPEVSEHAGQ